MQTSLGTAIRFKIAKVQEDKLIVILSEQNDQVKGSS